MSKTILILCPFFENHVGYQEVQFADALASMGHTVKVLTSDRSNLDLTKRYEDYSGKYEVKRIKKSLRIKNTFYPKEDLTGFFLNFSPQIVFSLLPGSGLPFFLLKYVNQNSKVISVFSDTTIDNRVANAKGTKGNKTIFNLLKKKWYKDVFKKSDLIMANTNETADILKSISLPDVAAKLRVYGLGFDSSKYFFSQQLRDEFRKKLGLSEKQKLLATVSRIYKGKPFEFWVEQVKNFLSKNKNFIYLLAGFDDTSYSKETEANLKKLNLPNLILHRFVSPEEANLIFNAADYSLWFAPSISIQQSMASGCFPIIPFDSTLDHLLENKVTGFYYNTFDDLKNILHTLDSHSYNREAAAGINSKYSYQNILSKVIEEVS